MEGDCTCSVLQTRVAELPRTAACLPCSASWPLQGSAQRVPCARCTDVLGAAQGCSRSPVPPQVEQRATEFMPGVKAGIEGRDSPDWLAVDAGEQQTKALSCLPGLSPVQGDQCCSGHPEHNLELTS